MRCKLQPYKVHTKAPGHILALLNILCLAFFSLNLSETAHAESFGWSGAYASCKVSNTTSSNATSDQAKMEITIYTSMSEPASKAVIGISGLSSPAMVIEASLKVTNRTIAEYIMPPMTVETKASHIVLDTTTMTATMSNLDGSDRIELSCKKAAPEKT